MQSSNHKVVVIGAGFAGLSAACYLARGGAQVTILEKHQQAGGRARRFCAKGFTFDMGPSWYWMPGVFEDFFEDFGTTVAKHYDLVRLDPSYRVFFDLDQKIDVPARLQDLFALFERIEPGSAGKLQRFLSEAEYKYRVGINEFVKRPSHSVLEFAELRVAKAAFGLHMLKGMGPYVDRLFKDERLRQILKFPVLFLGATPENTPALYSLMNYADLVLGTWYPMGGMHQSVEAMVSVARSLGVEIRYGANVEEIVVSKTRVVGVRTQEELVEAQIVVGAADYHHVEQQLLAPEHRQYSEDYWDRRTMAPSSLLFYLGIDKRVAGLKHHNLFFDQSFQQHAHEIYTEPRWPSNPLFYACVPSVTDPSVAPAGSENIFLLMPTAPDIGGDTEATREHYYNVMMDRLEAAVGEPIRDHVCFKRSYAETEFKEDYNAYKGNAYGLANTLRQTAFLKPKMKSSRVRGLYYAGQLTTPGPGVPPSIISGEVVAQEVLKSIGLSPKPVSLTTQRHGSTAAI